jgi:hypothetical protein
MPRHAKSEDAARNGFAPANLAPVAAVARPGLARVGTANSDAGFAARAVSSGDRLGAGGPRPGHAARR